MADSVIPPMRGAEEAGSAFWQKVLDISKRHGWDPRAIAAVMAVETGYTFAPNAGQSHWSTRRTATGLIQFIEATARGLGVRRTNIAPDERLQDLGQEKSWATWTLMGMSALDQLDLVEAYFERAFRIVKPTRPVDYYLVTWGTSPGKALSDVLARSGDRAYTANKGLDRDKNGAITVSDLQSFVMGAYPQTWQPQPGDAFPKPYPVPTASPQPSEAGHTSYLQDWLSWGSGSSHLAEPRAELPVLRYGNQGSVVAMLQALIRWRIEEKLDIDGAFGMKTTLQVRRYQEAFDLKIDGVVGRQTWSSIIGTVAACQFVELRELKESWTTE